METASTRVKRHKSKLISRAMKILGTSSYHCFLAKSMFLILDYLDLMSSQTIIHGGSLAEGTNTTGSDLDQMIVMPDITVYTTNKKTGFKKGHSFLLDETSSSPGYGRLRLLKFGHTRAGIKHFDLSDAKIKKLVQETTDGKFLSSENFVNLFLSDFKSLKHLIVTRSSRHGPCATAECLSYVLGTPRKKAEQDIALALVCDEWPTGAQKWVTRKRRYDWPPKDVIQKISKMKCHTVPVGKKWSSNFSLEWKMSFLLGERELVWNFNDTQVQCYVLLKCLIKKHIEPIAPEQLSSYHLKTIMFWMSEERDMSIWYDENLLGCVAECLNMLSHCVKMQELQHYFYKENNLLDNKLDNESEKERVLQKIDEIQADIERYVSERLVDWNGCTCWQTTYKNFMQVGNFAKMAKKTNDVRFLNETIFKIIANITISLNTFGKLTLELMSLKVNPPEDVDYQILEKTKVFIGIRLKLFCYGHFLAPKKIGIQMEDAYSLLNRGRYLDSLSGILYLASIYLSEGKFSLSNDLVLSVLKRDELLVYTGWCSLKCGIRLTEDGHSKLESDILLTGTEGETCLAYDVIFSSDDANCVPYPVKFECVVKHKDLRKNVIVIHPCVYAYFLLCLGQFYDRQYESFFNTLKQLEQLVLDLGNEFSVYRALNLLGYCYYLTGNIREALRFYSISLGRTQSHPMVENAAVYHICIILVKCLEVKRNLEILCDRHKHDS